jgi:hypothetical protein
MGAPRFDPPHIPLRREARRISTPAAGGETLRIGALSMGNPHAVLRVERLEDRSAWSASGRHREARRFPRTRQRGFMQVKGSRRDSPARLRARRRRDAGLRLRRLRRGVHGRSHGLAGRAGDSGIARR